MREYIEVDLPSSKIGLLEQFGYSPIGYFSLGKHSWLENYYRPLQSRFDSFLARHGGSDAARSIVDAEKREIDLYERYAAFISYGYYVAIRVDG